MVTLKTMVLLLLGLLILLIIYSFFFAGSHTQVSGKEIYPLSLALSYFVAPISVVFYVFGYKEGKSHVMDMFLLMVMFFYVTSVLVLSIFIIWSWLSLKIENSQSLGFFKEGILILFFLLILTHIFACFFEPASYGLKGGMPFPQMVTLCIITSPFWAVYYLLGYKVGDNPMVDEITVHIGALIFIMIMLCTVYIIGLWVWGGFLPSGSS